MQASDSKSAELAARLDRSPFSTSHRNLFALCFYRRDVRRVRLRVFGMALPPVAREFGLNPAQAGLLATVGLVGAFLGALFWGTISDYIGRRTASPPPSASSRSSPVLLRRIVERAVTRNLSIHLELRTWGRRGPGRAHTNRRIQPESNSRSHDRVDDGGVSLGLALAASSHC